MFVSYFHFGKNYGGKSEFPFFLFNNHFLNEIFPIFAPINHQTTIIDQKTENNVNIINQRISYYSHSNQKPRKLMIKKVG